MKASKENIINAFIIAAMLVMFINSAMNTADTRSMQKALMSQQLASINCAAFYEAMEYQEGEWVGNQFVSVEGYDELLRNQLNERNISWEEYENNGTLQDKISQQFIKEKMKSSATFGYYRNCKNLTDIAVESVEDVSYGFSDNALQLLAALLLLAALYANFAWREDIKSDKSAAQRL